MKVSVGGVFGTNSREHLSAAAQTEKKKGLIPDTIWGEPARDALNQKML
jgi:hypothetical protein